MLLFVQSGTSTSTLQHTVHGNPMPVWTGFRNGTAPPVGGQEKALATLQAKATKRRERETKKRKRAAKREAKIRKDRISLRELVQRNIIVAGPKVLSLTYKGQRVLLDLMEDGNIVWLVTPLLQLYCPDASIIDLNSGFSCVPFLS